MIVTISISSVSSQTPDIPPTPEIPASQVFEMPINPYERGGPQLFVAPKNYNLTGYCPRLDQMVNTSNPYVTAESALTGAVVTIGINRDVPSFYMTFNKSHPNGGFMYDLHLELAARAKCYIQYVILPNISTYLDTDEYLKEMLPQVDLYAGRTVPDNSDRRINYNWGFTRQVTDASVVLVSPAMKTKDFSLWTFTFPFSDYLWFAIFGVVFFHALAFFLFERYLGPREVPKDSPTTFDDDGNPIFYEQNHVPFYLTVFLAINKMANAESETQPSSATGKIAKVGYHFFVLFILAAYLANQSNMLVTPVAVKLDILSLSDAIAKKDKVCALTGANEWCMDCSWKDTTPFGIANTSYPQLNIVQIDSNDEVDLMKAINDGKCVGALMTRSAFDAVQNRAEGNIKCDIIDTKFQITRLSGAW
jgi:Ligand-gated ion channel